MKKIWLLLILTLALVGCTQSPEDVERTQDVKEIEENIKKMEARNIMLKGHDDGGRISTHLDDEEPHWDYLINYAGIDYDIEKERIQEISDIQFELGNDEYLCLEEETAKRIILPYLMTFRNEDIYKYTPQLKAFNLKIDGYELFQVRYNYLYKESDFKFEDGKTKKLILDETRLYLSSITFKNQENHLVEIDWDKHEKGYCYLSNDHKYDDFEIYETENYDWFFFESEEGSISVMSFISGNAIQSDITIFEGTPIDFSKYTGNGPFTFESKWYSEDKENFYTFIDQLGDLSFLDTARVHWISTVPYGNWRQVIIE